MQEGKQGTRQKVRKKSCKNIGKNVLNESGKELVEKVCKKRRKELGKCACWESSKELGKKLPKKVASN